VSTHGGSQFCRLRRSASHENSHPADRDRRRRACQRRSIRVGDGRSRICRNGRRWCATRSSGRVTISCLGRDARRPRHLFVSPSLLAKAYERILCPSGRADDLATVHSSVMTQILLSRGPTDVLEVGTGSGIRRRSPRSSLGVYSVEIFESLPPQPTDALRPRVRNRCRPAGGTGITAGRRRPLRRYHRDLAGDTFPRLFGDSGERGG